jgi:hypothetical protein
MYAQTLPERTQQNVISQNKVKSVSHDKSAPSPVHS